MVSLPTHSIGSVPEQYRAYYAGADGQLTNWEALKYKSDKKNRGDDVLLTLDYREAMKQLQISQKEADRLRKKQQGIMEANKDTAETINELKSTIEAYANDWAPKGDLEAVKKQLDRTSASLSKTKTLLRMSTAKYDVASKSIKQLNSRLNSYRRVISAKQRALIKMQANYRKALTASATTRSQLATLRMKALADMSNARKEIATLKSQLTATEEEINELNLKIMEAEKTQKAYRENSLSQAVLNVRDAAFNTTFPNLSGVSENQSRGLAFLTGLVLVGFMVGRIE